MRRCSCPRAAGRASSRPPRRSGRRSRRPGAGAWYWALLCSASPRLGEAAGPGGACPFSRWSLDRAGAAERRWRSRGTRARVARRAVAVACAVAPRPRSCSWTARNCRVMDGCALVSYLERRLEPRHRRVPARRRGRFETLRSSDGCAVVTGQRVQQDRCWLPAYGLAQIRAHPGTGWLSCRRSSASPSITSPSRWSICTRRVPRRGPRWHAGRTLARDDHCWRTGSCWRARRSAASLYPRLWSVAWRGPSRALLLVVAGALVALAFTADTPVFWPLAIFVAVVPWLPLPRSPPRPAAGPASAAGAPRHDAGHARRLLRRGSLSHGGHSGACSDGGCVAEKARAVLSRGHIHGMGQRSRAGGTIATGSARSSWKRSGRSPWRARARSSGSANVRPMCRLFLLFASIQCLTVLACSSASSTGDTPDSGSGGSSGGSGSSSGSSPARRAA